METIFKRVHSGKDLAISSATIAVGIGLYFANAALGVLIASCGLLMLLFYKAACKREGDDTLLERSALELPVSRRESLKGFLEGKNVEPDLGGIAEGVIIRMEMFYNADASLAYVQLFDFVNYSYVPATGLVELRGERADKMIKTLKTAI